MSSIPKLLESTFDDLGLLARQYAQLSALKVKKSSKQGLIGMGMLGSAATLFLIVIAELIFSLSAAIVDLDQVAQAAVIAAGITTVVAIVFAGIGQAALKKIDVDPRVTVPTPDFDLSLNQLKPRGI